MTDSRFQFDLTIVAGDDYPVELIFYDKADDGTLTPEDISDRDWFYTAKVSASDADADAIIKVDPASMVVDSDGDATNNPTDVTNRLKFDLPAASTNVTARAYHQDLQTVYTVGGRVFTRGLGTLTVLDDVTDRVS